MWILLGKDAAFKVERLSRGRTRGNLIDQNPESVIKFLEHLSSSGKRIGLWNDATRCVDLSDVTIFDPSDGISFVELKEGKVNDAIFATIKAGTVAAIDTFFATFGEKGIKQLERTVKQEIDAQDHELLLKHDNLIDPFRGVYRATITPSIVADSYDDELKESLSRIRASDSTTLTVDDCLHLIIVNAERIDRAKGRSIIDKYFSRVVSKPQGDQVDPRKAILDSVTGFPDRQQCQFFSGDLTRRIFPGSA